MSTFICAQTGMVRDATQEARAERAKSRAIQLAAAALNRMEIARVCGRYELEPDEFQTAEEKARALLAASEGK